MKGKKTTIKIRDRKLKDGKKSIFLDIRHNGERCTRFLKLYLIPENKSTDKEQNKKTLDLADQHVKEVEKQINLGTFGRTNPFDETSNFLEYFAALTEQRRGNKKTYSVWHACLKHLQKYYPEPIPLKNIAPNFVEGFKTYLNNEAKTKYKTHFSPNSQNCYFQKLRAALNQAFEDELLPSNPAAKIKSPEPPPESRAFLTQEELSRLIKTECGNPILKDAFLLACHGGFTWHKVVTLTWKQVFNNHHSHKNPFVFPEGEEYLLPAYLTDQLWKKKGRRNEKVFPGLKSSTHLNNTLKRWVQATGIQKHITFRCAKHTYINKFLKISNAELAQSIEKVKQEFRKNHIPILYEKVAKIARENLIKERLRTLQRKFGYKNLKTLKIYLKTWNNNED